MMSLLAALKSLPDDDGGLFKGVDRIDGTSCIFNVTPPLRGTRKAWDVFCAWESSPGEDPQRMLRSFARPEGVAECMANNFDAIVQAIPED